MAIFEKTIRNKNFDKLLRKLENGGEDTQPKKKGFFEKLKEDME